MLYEVITALNTLVKGQKLPIFTCAGLPVRELTEQLLRQARLPRGGPFVLVFVALGLTHFEYHEYAQTLSQLPGNFVAFVNLADDPVVERLQAPRLGLTVAEDLAFNRGDDVLVIIADMANYCDALREVSTAREELPGRRGYPGHMYSDLASLFERAGRIHGRPGAVTMLPVITSYSIHYTKLYEACGETTGLLSARFYPFPTPWSNSVVSRGRKT